MQLPEFTSVHKYHMHSACLVLITTDHQWCFALVTGQQACRVALLNLHNFAMSNTAAKAVIAAVTDTPVT